MSRPFARWALALGVASALTVLAASANTAVDPQPRGGEWRARHEGFVAQAKAGGIDVLFLGDSITDRWRREGRHIWAAHFEPLRAANFGIGGDRTQHLLWRLQHGAVDGISPRVVVLLIGTNNTGLEPDKVTPRNRPEEVIAGVAAVARTLRARLPTAKILLLAIFPWGGKDEPWRAQLATINAGISRLHDGRYVHFLDIGRRFLYPDGTLPVEFMPDLVHPNEVGYAIWADAIRGPLAELLQP